MKKIVWRILNNLGLGAYVQIFLFSYLKDKGWAKSFHKKQAIDANGLPVPWLTYAFVDFIEERLNKSMVMFEYGSGNSTLWFAERVGEIFSVEYDKKWHNLINAKKAKNSTIFFQSIDNKIDYIEAIKLPNKKYDFILIDGRFRNKCASIAIDYIKENGVIIIDNTNVGFYKQGIDFIISKGYKKIDFNSMLPALHTLGKTTLLYKQGNNVLDI